ncbi:MAG: Tad domain-containing protein [Fimbriimonadaceae bacterium]|nr:Tad domain-containing protein [Fimbriimonadaceae bacterium]
MNRLRQRRRAGQTIVLLALVLGILMIMAALVIDVGSTHRVRTETQYVSDAGALAGIAELLNSRDVNAARTKALEVCRLNGYSVGSNGVTMIIARAFNHNAWPEEDPSKIDVADSDRYEVTIHRELPQYIANIIGIGRTGTIQGAVAAIIGSVPIDAALGSLLGLPDEANLSQFGPDAPYTFGDAYSTKRLDNGAPNPRYDPLGYIYDLAVPDDLQSSTGSAFVRVEIFDPDTINRGTHVAKQPSQLTYGADRSEPSGGGMDEIRATPPNGNADTNPAQFPTRSTQTDFTLVDRNGQVIATASYGPTGNTPFWTIRQAPASDALNNASHADPAQAQIATDLKWITPQGFEFDTRLHPRPYNMRVKTISGSSENGYMLRVGAQRASGVVYDPVTHGTTASSSIAVYARGKVPINFRTSDVSKIPIGNVPSSAKQVIVTNFDADVGSQSVKFSMSSFDSSSGQGKYPVLWPAPPSASGSNVVTDTNGSKYYTNVPGTLSPNGEFRTDTIDIPQTVAVPQTDGNGNLLLNGAGRVVVVDTRPFEGADLEISYTSGQYDTSVWECSFIGPPGGGQQRIVLIR